MTPALLFVCCVFWPFHCIFSLVWIACHSFFSPTHQGIIDLSYLCLYFCYKVSIGDNLWIYEDKKFEGGNFYTMSLMCDLEDEGHAHWHCLRRMCGSGLPTYVHPLMFRLLSRLAKICWERFLYIGGSLYVYCNFYCSPAKKIFPDLPFFWAGGTTGHAQVTSPISACICPTKLI